MYGLLYNWHVTKKNIAPKGWRVAPDSDWAVLINYIGGEQVAGGRLKEPGRKYWNSFENSDFVGFNARAAGYRMSDGNFVLPYGEIGSRAAFWTSTSTIFESSYVRVISQYNTLINRESKSVNFGFSIRCIKN